MEFVGVRNAINILKEVLSNFDEDAFSLLPTFKQKLFSNFLIPILDTIDNMRNKELQQDQRIDQQQNSFDAFFILDRLYIKNYFAEKHNEKVNKHKSNCLSTFNTFIDSADEETKRVILQITTQTIFSHQSSGYSSKDNNPNNPNPVIEVVKNITSAGQSS